MEYTLIERQTLDIMKRTDFKNLSKNDVVSIVSKLSELRLDVAKEVIAQFPEFAKLIRSSMEEYKDILGNIIDSDDKSIKQVYAVIEKDMDTSADSRKQYKNEITEEVITEIAKQKPYYFVMCDSSMANDSVPTNFEQIIAAYSPDTVRKVL